jgi:hypothetical protein
MGCNCGGGSGNGTGTFEVRFPDGSTKVYTTEIDAKVAAAKSGGTWRKA